MHAKQGALYKAYYYAVGDDREGGVLQTYKRK